MLLFDGAMGTMKQAGLDTRSIHRAYIQAGSQVVTTDTFMANRLSTSDVEGENARALEAARETNVLVAGDLGPTIATSKDYPLSCFHGLYREQAKALKGVDFWLVETVVDLEVARAAVRACLKVDPDVPVLVSMIPSIAPEKAVQAFDGFPLSALGYNCGSGPLQSASSLSRLASLSPFPLIWEPSAGLPEQGRYPFDCQEWAKAVRSVLAHTPVAYVGGCCGTTPAYIQALAYCTFSRNPPILEPNPYIVLEEDSMGKTKKSNFNVFEIMFGIMWLAMGLEGIGQGNGGQSIGRFYASIGKWFGKAGDSMVTILGVLILVSAVIYLVQKFVPAVPAQLTKAAMVFMVIVWAVTVLCCLIFDIGHLDGFADFLAMVENLFINLLILSATISFCGESVTK